MSQATGGEDRKRPNTVAARLALTLGSEVDPRVDLPSESRLSESGPVLDRLGTRSLAASRYQLRGEIARGGMGAILEVFDEDLRRPLAMKVILDPRSGKTTTDAASVHPSLLARFLEEAQVTGQLDHPGIVPVHELGLDEQGQVYFTMRLVHGRDLESIFDLALRDEEGWSQARAVGVLLKVCEAMAYAHSKGVVHRDLKPGNVMVGRFGEVYVMDWGLARVRDREDRHDLRIRGLSPAEAARAGTGARSSESPRPSEERAVETDRREAAASGAAEALMTMDGSVVGTPCYMPLEQARGQVAALDERSDVYAVGAMLYRLLAGAAPYATSGTLPPASEIVLQVLEGPPDSLESLAPTAPAELSAICARAMAREPDDRYPDMQALAEDLRAFLEGRVVQAFETGAWAEARKWIRRNRALSGSLAGLLVALVVGLFASLRFAREAETQAQLAEARRTDAESSAASALRQAAIAENANAFLNEDLLSAVAPESGGIDVTVREILGQAGRRLEGRFAGEPLVEAALRGTLGRSHEALGDYPTARAHLERALELRLAAEGPLARLTLETQGTLARVQGALGERAAALGRFEQSIAAARESLGAESPEVLSLQCDYTTLLRESGRSAEARSILEQTLRTAREELGPEHPTTLTAANNLAILEMRGGELEAAAVRLREVLDLRNRSLGQEHPETLNAASNLCQALSELGQFEAAVKESRALLEIRRRVLGNDHPQVARELGNQGTFLFRLGRADEALACFREAASLLVARFGEEHPDALGARHNLAAALLETDAFPEGLEMELPVLATRLRTLGPEHDDTLMSMNSAAVGHQRSGDFAAAESLLREALATRQRTRGALHPDTLIVQENLAGLLFRVGKSEEALEGVRAVLAGRTEALGAGHPDTAKTCFNLAMVLRSAGQTAEARETADDALQRIEDAGLSGSPLHCECLRLSGDLAYGEGDHALALAAYEEALDCRAAMPGLPNEQTGYLLHQLGMSEFHRNEMPEALRRLDQALELRLKLLGPDAEPTLFTQLSRAAVLQRLGRFEEAEPLALELMERAQRTAPSDAALQQRIRQLLVDLYTRWGRPQDADRWR